MRRDHGVLVGGVVTRNNRFNELSDVPVTTVGMLGGDVFVEPKQLVFLTNDVASAYINSVTMITHLIAGIHKGLAPRADGYAQPFYNHLRSRLDAVIRHSTPRWSSLSASPPSSPSLWRRSHHLTALLQASGAHLAPRSRHAMRVPPGGRVHIRSPSRVLSRLLATTAPPARAGIRCIWELQGHAAAIYATSAPPALA